MAKITAKKVVKKVQPSGFPTETSESYRAQGSLKNTVMPPGPAKKKAKKK